MEFRVLYIPGTLPVSYITNCQFIFVKKIIFELAFINNMKDSIVTIPYMCTVYFEQVQEIL
jgi:hypothetical protein